MAIAAGLATGSHALAIPVSIVWQIPLNKREDYLLEVARDAGFSVVVLRAQVRGTGFVWDAPTEGVYHWRLRRALDFESLGPSAGQQPTSAVGSSMPDLIERSSFVSGSFAAVRADLKRREPARLTWDAQPGADNYKLYVLDEGLRPRTMITEQPSFMVPQSEHDLMIEVVPYSGGKRTFRFFHFNPSLKLDSGLFPEEEASLAASPLALPMTSESRTTTSNVLAERPEASEDGQGVYDPRLSADTDSIHEISSSDGGDVDRVTKPTQANIQPDNLLRPRRHMVHAYGLAGREAMRLQKLAIDFESQATVSGGGAGVWLNPAAGLIVAAEGSYHEHRADAAQESLFPGKRYKVYGARYTAELAVGWDLLHALAAPHSGHRLPLSLMGAAVQMPQLPLEPVFEAVRDMQSLPLQKYQAILAGAGLGYGWFGEYLGLLLEGGVLFADSALDKAKMRFQRLRVDAYLSDRLAIQIGGMTRYTELRRCHADVRLCLAGGKSLTFSNEINGFLGVAAILR